MTRPPARSVLAAASILAAPFLVAAAPIVALWGPNRLEFGAAEVVPPLVVAFIVGGIAVAAAVRVIPSLGLAAVGAAVAAAAAFGLGYQMDLVRRFTSEQRAESLAPLIGLLDATFVVAVIVALRRFARLGTGDGRDAARAVSVAAIAWMAIALAPGPQQSQAGGVAEGAEYLIGADPAEPPAPPIGPLTAPSGATLPDVYYVILDGYARWDVLRDAYAYDELPFLEELRRRGFYVADQSSSNYPGTQVSLSSSLNMRYVTPELVARAPLERYVQLIRRNEVARTFRELGYRYDLVRSVWVGTSISPLADEQLGLGPAFGSEFAVAVANRSLLKAVSPPPSVAASHLAAFDDLERIPADEGPTFTLAHVILPHPPYVLDRDGRILSDTPVLEGVWRTEAAKAGYLEQLRFVNRRVLEAIDAILASSDVRPIIVVQGDHGAFVDEGPDDPDGSRARLARLAILNAYLVPDGMRSDLYPSISPVNTFRIVLPRLAGEEPELLPDRHFPYSGPGRDGFVEARPLLPASPAPSPAP